MATLDAPAMRLFLAQPMRMWPISTRFNNAPSRTLALGFFDRRSSQGREALHRGRMVTMAAPVMRLFLAQGRSPPLCSKVEVGNRMLRAPAILFTAENRLTIRTEGFATRQSIAQLAPKAVVWLRLASAGLSLARDDL